MSIEDRLHYAKIILRELKERPLTWDELERKVIVHCGTHSRFVRVMRWLLDQGYIIKMGPPRTRAPYRLNPEKVSFNKDGSVIIKIS